MSLILCMDLYYNQCEYNLFFSCLYVAGTGLSQTAEGVSLPILCSKAHSQDT